MTNNFLRSVNSILLVLGVLGASVQQAEGSWFSDFTGINVDLQAGRVQIGTPQPIRGIQVLPGVLSRLPQDVANLGNPAGVALAVAIRHAKAQAARGARDMPPYIRQALERYFPADILDSVKFNTFDRTRLALDAATMMLN